MRFSLFFLFTVAVCAQAQEPAPPAAPMGPGPGDRVVTVDMGKALADARSGVVVATFDDGRKITLGELDSFLAAMPPNLAQNARRDRRGFVQQFALMLRLSEMAEKAKLDQQSPTREALAFNRMYLLMNAQLHEVLMGINVTPAEAQADYDQNKQRFAQVKVKALYIAYSTNPPAGGATDAKRRTEGEAEAKIARLRAAITGGADFVKLVKENSEDQISAAKDGDFGTLRSTDKLPDAIRAAIFSLKTGEVSEPVKQPNGFYLFRAEEVGTQPFAEVQQTVVNELKEARFKLWMEEATRDLHLKIENETFFKEGAAAPGK